MAAIVADEKAITCNVSVQYLVLDRASYHNLTKAAEHDRRRVASYLKRIILRGFRVCFGDEQDNETAVVA